MMTRRFRELEQESGTHVVEHLDAFDELVKAKDIIPIKVKEKLLKESDRLQKKEASEKAFRATDSDRRIKGRHGIGRKNYAPRKDGAF
ncbi:uncharacterized protein PHALS_06171 [Plasmopara halstedii]|uniref:Uncharacterized protein n=1 Tax=Plasmopara halstedii TaxID=4781 RepID=A0A0P1B1P0_PLAHL|nr:uncharacterized protein PHALS_06171 [Plasmopara halstedii]CEG48345.1 hypothetical protein PHALS_06171 [Plasmopara halstedii]|eukprot:XP_024584714.1 hypothetical protein PHALS_06171 [Plasmopara halstedii]